MTIYLQITYLIKELVLRIYEEPMQHKAVNPMKKLSKVLKWTHHHRR
jgi:hypothetical protein